MGKRNPNGDHQSNQKNKKPKTDFDDKNYSPVSNNSNEGSKEIDVNVLNNRTLTKKQMQNHITNIQNYIKDLNEFLKNNKEINKTERQDIENKINEINNKMNYIVHNQDTKNPETYKLILGMISGIFAMYVLKNNISGGNKKTKKTKKHKNKKSTTKKNRK